MRKGISVALCLGLLAFIIYHLDVVGGEKAKNRPQNGQTGGELAVIGNGSGYFAENQTAGGSKSPSSPYLYTPRWIPPVIYNDGVTSTTLEVVTQESDITGVFVKFLGVEHQLYDDGTHGDRIPNDGIYTISGLTTTLPPLRWWRGGGTHTTLFGATRDIRITKSTGPDEFGLTPYLAIVDKDQYFPAAELGDGLLATEYAFFIIDEERSVFPGFPLTKIYCGKGNYEAFKKLYSKFPDVFDFAAVMPSGTIYDPTNFGENVPYFVGAKNEIQNIGLPIFDNTHLFGSSGRLMGAIYHSFGYGAILDHEIGHGWGIGFGGSFNLTNIPGGLGHWTPYGDIYGTNYNTDIFGQMAGFPLLQDNGDGTFRIVSIEERRNYVPYAKITLYLMGLVPPDSVPPVHLLTNPDYTDSNRVTAASIDTITIEELIQAEGGERIPSYENSQKDFTMAFIAVSPDTFTAAELAFFSLVSKFFGSDMPGEGFLMPFATATGYRATLSTRLPGLTIANFAGSPQSGEAPLTVQFTDQSIGQISSWLWDFGDGESAVDANPSHTYSDPGSYTVKLTVTAPNGQDSETKTDFISVSSPTDVSEQDVATASQIPEQFWLSQNYPNPCNPETTIHYELPQTGSVTLKIYNLLGQEVRTLVDEEKQAGFFTVHWDGKDNSGEKVCSGIYLYRLEADGFIATKKMVLIR